MQSELIERPLTRTLPPLILHPFADASGPGKLMDSSRASMMLQGLLPTGELTAEQLDQRLLDGRYCEIRMLFYVGKDLLRWIEQCQEVVGRDAASQGRRYTSQSFVSHLILKTPAGVQDKLRKWGVADYRSIFARAIALNSIFAIVPDRLTLSDDFVRHYHRYADALFQIAVDSPGPAFDETFEFELFASGEYSRMLERQWGGESVE
jgi:hypothetical protein